jgi:hypothetical protein
MQNATLGKPGEPARACDLAPAARVTRSLLGWGVVAGPFYVAVVLGQALLRPGFDLAHDDASLLSSGGLGWIQVANFLITGAMVVACAAGVYRALGRGRASASGALLLALFGVGLIGAGFFVADPMSGFPPGTPSGRPETISPHGILHIVSAGLGFLGLAGACLVVGQRFARDRRPAWAWFSRLTGVLFLLGFAGLASGSSSAAVVIGFWAVLLLAWGWLAALALNLYRRAAEGV